MDDLREQKAGSIDPAGGIFGRRHSDSISVIRNRAEASRLKGAAIIDAEVICESDGIADFEALQSRCKDHLAIAVAFDLLKGDGEDLRPMPLTPTAPACMGFA